MNAKATITKTYETIATGGYIRIMDIIDRVDIPAAEFETAIRELYTEGWEIIPNSQGGDVEDDERAYCPKIGNRQVHLIKR